MSAPKEEGLQPLKDRAIKTAAAPINLHEITDAQIWTREFLRTIAEHPTIPTDEGTMLGWFANAIMAGYDDARRRYETTVPPPTQQPIGGYNLMTSANPTAAEIREVIAHLKTLADTFPGIIHAANGAGLSGSPMNTMGALDRACEMLRLHSIDVEEREEKRRVERERELVHTLFDNGVKTGIEQEQARVKEARKGRRGAKKS